MIGTPHDLIAHLQAQVNVLATETLALKQSVKEIAEAMAAHAMPADDPKIPRGAEIEGAEDQKGDPQWVPEDASKGKKKGSD